jgi:methionine synthase II (cobalamin-independent)
LRPEKLLFFKNQTENSDKITYLFYEDFEGYEECELEVTKDVVRKEIDHGIEIITDGEFSRSLWYLDFVWGLKDVARYIAEYGYFFVIKTK